MQSRIIVSTPTGTKILRLEAKKLLAPESPWAKSTEQNKVRIVSDEIRFMISVFS